jgi:uncharacterized protein YegJ (DUF2314 family)
MSIFKKLFSKSNQPEEPIAWFEDQSPEMNSAIQQAQASYAEIEQAMLDDRQRVLPAIEESLIKYAFPATKKGVLVEHMFISDLHHDGETLVGTLASDPMYTSKVKCGMEIKIDPARVSDWLFILGGETKGGFTFKCMWNTFSSDEKNMYRNEPPFSWLKL